MFWCGEMKGTEVRGEETFSSAQERILGAQDGLEELEIWRFGC